MKWWQKGLVLGFSIILILEIINFIYNINFETKIIHSLISFINYGIPILAASFLFYYLRLKTETYPKLKKLLQSLRVAFLVSLYPIIIYRLEMLYTTLLFNDYSASRELLKWMAPVVEIGILESLNTMLFNIQPATFVQKLKFVLMYFLIGFIVALTYSYLIKPLFKLLVKELKDGLKKKEKNSLCWFYVIFTTLRVLLIFSLLGVLFSLIDNFHSAFLPIILLIPIILSLHLLVMFKKNLKEWVIFLYPLVFIVLGTIVTFLLKPIDKHYWTWAGKDIPIYSLIILLPIAVILFFELKSRIFRNISYALTSIWILWLIFTFTWVTTASISDYNQCSIDSDCILVASGVCGCGSGGENTAINKKYKKRYEWLMSYWSQGISCIAVISDHPSCSGTPVCRNNICAVALPGEKELKFETVVHDYDDKHGMVRKMVITSQEEWSSFWHGDLNRSSTPPAIDFSKDMLITAFDWQWSGEGGDIEITKITETSDVILVYIQRTRPQKDVELAPIVGPYHIVKVNKTDKKLMME